jgi:universal stress protein A
MPQFRKVLCPINFDENSLLALGTASEIVREQKSVLVLLHVVEIPGAPEVALPFAKLEAAARTQLQRFIAKVKMPVRTEIEVRMGDPGTEIISAARKRTADLIVMATHGRKGLRRLVLGSVAESVIRQAPCPVLTIRPHSLATKPERSRLRKIESGLIDGSTSL